MRVGLAKPGYRQFPVTFTILSVTVAIQLLAFTQPDRWADLVDLFAMYGPSVDRGEWWRLITVTLVHGGLMHLAFNMYALYILGVQLERELGVARFLTLWFGTATVASAFIYFLTPSGLTVGASGAIFGLFGVMVSSALQRRGTVAGRMMLSQLSGILIINILLPFVVPNVSWQGHLGGFVGGFVIGDLWYRTRHFHNAKWVHVAIGSAVAMVAFLAVIL